MTHQASHHKLALDLDNAEALQYLLGAALLGAGVRLGVEGLRETGLFSNAKRTLKSDDDIFEAEVPIPIKVPQSVAAQARSSRATQDTTDTDKTAADFATSKKHAAVSSLAASAPTAPMTKAAGIELDTFHLLGGLGGLGLGWYVVHKLLTSARERAMNAKLKQLQREYEQLASMDPYEIDDETSSHRDTKAASDHRASVDDQIKMAVAWDVLDIVAENYAKRKAAIAQMDRVHQQLVKQAGLGRALKTTWSRATPYEKALYVSIPALLGVSSLPPVIEQFKDLTTDAVSAPVSAAISVLSPIITAGLLYGLYRGYQAAKESDPDAAKIKELRKSIRKLETQESPYFALDPMPVHHA